MWQRIKDLPMCQIHLVDILGVLAWLYFYIQNFVHGAHFDLDKFWQMYVTVRGWISAQYAIDSKWNSGAGEKPNGVRKNGQTLP